MNLFQRLQGVFFDPKRTFDGLAAKPVWIDAFVLVIVALIAFNLVVAPYMMKDQLDREKNSAALKERLGEDNYAKRIYALENPSSFSVIVGTFVITLLFFIVAILLQALILLTMGRLVSTHGTYVQVLSVLVHASFIDKLLGNSLRMVLVLSRKSAMQMTTGLAMLFPKLEVTSTLYIVMNQIDLFQLWMFGVLAFGLAATFKIQLRKALVLSYGLWFIKALFNIGLGMLQMSFYR
ncbi:MAG: hypothetical protein HGA24_10750 [Candidatus Aminicenantes bacterium]|nr:hypothetical protein [Candidatus Aminicenantes bacterium]